MRGPSPLYAGFGMLEPSIFASTQDYVWNSRFESSAQLALSIAEEFTPYSWNDSQSQRVQNAKVQFLRNSSDALLPQRADGSDWSPYWEPILELMSPSSGKNSSNVHYKDVHRALAKQF